MAVAVALGAIPSEPLSEKAHLTLRGWREWELKCRLLLMTEVGTDGAGSTIGLPSGQTFYK